MGTRAASRGVPTWPRTAGTVECSICNGTGAFKNLKCPYSIHGVVASNFPEYSKFYENMVLHRCHDPSCAKSNTSCDGAGGPFSFIVCMVCKNTSFVFGHCGLCSVSNKSRQHLVVCTMCICPRCGGTEKILKT